MMRYPVEMVAAVQEIVQRNNSNIEQAVTEAVAEVCGRDDYEDVAKSLVEQAVRELVYDIRHRLNVQAKRESGRYGQPAKVVVGSGKEVNAICQSLYDYYIAGTTLGMLMGDRLSEIAESEKAKAEGHSFNARLCEMLRPLVPDGKRVRDCVPEAKLRKMFKKSKELAAAA